MDELRTNPEESDEALVRLAQAGQEPVHRAAASRLVTRYAARVLAYCRKYACDTDRALDLSQDVLMAAYEALPRFEGRAPFSAWLFTIARNRCLRSVRRPRWTRDDEADVDTLSSAALPPDEVVNEKQEQSLIERIIGERLEPVERQALILRCLECLSVDEITRTLRITQASGARGVLQTARRKLRAALEERGEPR